MNYAVIWLLSVFLLPRISVKITVIGADRNDALLLIVRRG